MLFRGGGNRRGRDVSAMVFGSRSGFVKRMVRLMVKFSARQKYVLSLLADTRLVDIKQLSKQMEISERTILREISAINHMVENRSVRLVFKNPLLHMEGTEQAIEQIKKDLGDICKPQLLTTEQRILFITAQLLMADEPCKSAFFSYQMDVTEATISMYMEKIEKRLPKHNLLMDRQRAFGIQITGTEWDKRNALVDVIYAYKPPEDLLSFIYQTRQELTTKLLFDVLFGKKTLGYTRDTLDFVADKLADEDDMEYLKAFLYIAISLKKSLDGGSLQLSAAFKQDACSNDPALFSSLRQFLQQMPAPLPEDEIVYIFIHLPGNQYQHSMDQKFQALGIPLEKLSEEVLYEIQTKGGAAVQSDRQLIDGMARQLNASVCRAYMGIQLPNPLLAQVHRYYGTLYDAVKHACDVVFSKYNIRLSENEIGNITMYVGYMLDSGETLYNDISILIICPNGMGAARILSAKIQKLFPIIQSITINSLKGWEENSQPYDLILSTVDIKNLRRNRKDRVFVVSPFLSTEDIRRIGQTIDTIRLEKETRSETPSLSCAPDHVRSQASESIDKMFEALRIETVDAADMPGLIHNIASRLSGEAVVTDREEIERRILNREKIGSVVIPNSRLALLHTRSEVVAAPYVGIYRLRGQMLLHNPHSNDEPVDTFVVLLAKESEHPLVLESLGSLSMSLVDHPELAETLRTGSPEEVRQKVGKICLCPANR